MNEADQLIMGTGPAPFDYPFHALGTGSNNTNHTRPAEVIIRVAPNDFVSTFLCSESENVKRTFLLGPGAKARIFIDAWTSWQTTPINVQAFTVNAGNEPAKYNWKLYNYIPIGSGITEGNGVAEYCSQVPADTEGPYILTTLGHTNRSPTGEFPVSRATKERECVCASDRPFLVFENESRSSTVRLVIKVAQ